jgi:hypothetical protein
MSLQDTFAVDRETFPVDNLNDAIAVNIIIKAMTLEIIQCYFLYSSLGTLSPLDIANRIWREDS